MTLKTNYVLIDYENVQVKSLALLNGDHFRVYVFLGKNNTKLHRKLVIEMHGLGERANYIELESSGSNALDFHIAYYVGRLAVANPNGFMHIISKDTGFDPLVRYLKTQKIMAARSASIEAMPCFVQKKDSTTTSPAAVAKPAPSTQVKSTAKKTSTEVDERINEAVAHLIAHKAKRPAKMKTLLNTIHNKIGMERSVAEAEAVRDALVERGYVLPEGLKVKYDLPTPG